jgi:hypothetical protein
MMKKNKMMRNIAKGVGVLPMTGFVISLISVNGGLDDHQKQLMKETKSTAVNSALNGIPAVDNDHESIYEWLLSS